MEYIYITLLIILLILFAFTIAFDLYLYYKSIFNRIHIGRWNDKKKWLEQIAKINYAWLNDVPTVKLTDNSKYVILDIYKGKYKSKSIQSWQEGGLLFGAIASEKADDDLSRKKLHNFIYQRIDENTGKWKTKPEYVDGVILGYAISKYRPNLDNIKPALDETIKIIEKL